MKCVLFTLPEKTNNILIFKELSIKNYTWNITWADFLFYDKEGNVVSENYLVNQIEDDHKIEGSKFEKILETYSYYPIFLDAKAFRNNDEMVSVHSFDNFLKSHCSFYFIIADSNYAEFCSKDESIANQVIHSCNEFDLPIIEVIEDQNKIRELFDLH